MGSQVRTRQSGPKAADRRHPSYNSLGDTASGRHDLQYFEMFCNVGIGKASRFKEGINWVFKSLSAAVLPVAQAKQSKAKSGA